MAAVCNLPPEATWQGEGRHHPDPSVYILGSHLHSSGSGSNGGVAQIGPILPISSAAVPALLLLLLLGRASALVPSAGVETKVFAEGHTRSLTKLGTEFRLISTLIP